MDKYLLEILKESNTIIIPGLGALTVTNNETGETMFMPYLQHDDGKLAGFIAQKDGIDEADAKIMVAKYVREIKSELDKGESYSMFELGNFVKADDGDIEFTHWSNLSEKEEDDTVIVPAPVIADEPVLETEPEIVPEPESTVEVEPIPEPEPIEIKEEEIENTIDETLENSPEPEVEAESIAETSEIPEEFVATVLEDSTPIDEDIVSEEPIVEPEPVVEEITRPELDADEIEIKSAIEETLKNISKPEIEPIVEATETPEIPKKVIPVVVPEPVNERISPAAAAAALGGMSIPENEPIDADTPVEQSAGTGEEQSAKDKPTPKFWITMIIIALLIIAGGAYVGRNYNELKQHIPFLADAKETDKPNSSEDEAESNDEDTYTGDRYRSKEENNSQEKTDETSQDAEEKVETPVEPKPEPISKPDPVVEPSPIITPTASSSGHYHIIAGAFSSIDNANQLAKDFQARGLPAKVIKNGELNAVSMQSYATSEDAHADLNKMNSIVKGAWILYK